MKKQQQFEVNNGYAILEYVHCAVCNKKIGLNATCKDFPSLGWLDPYNKTYYFFKGIKGCYVHQDCLSAQRKAEITKEITSESVQKG